ESPIFKGPTPLAAITELECPLTCLPPVWAVNPMTNNGQQAETQKVRMHRFLSDRIVPILREVACFRSVGSRSGRIVANSSLTLSSHSGRDRIAGRVPAFPMDCTPKVRQRVS